MIVVTALGLNLGLVPWPACALTGAMLIPPLFLPSITLIDWGALYSVAALFAWLSIGLSRPMITTECRWGRIGGPAASPAPAGISVAAPTGENSVSIGAPTLGSAEPDGRGPMPRPGTGEP
jgi:hypothetical protein